jgi:dTDP-glucose 4,6-dehydratase
MIKNVLITGGYGFIASNFLVYLVNKYKDINFYNYDCLLYCASVKNVEEIVNEPNFKTTTNKLQNKEFLLSYMIDNNIDCVMHFAAQSHVEYSFNNSLDYTNDNIYGTHILLECCRIYGKIIRFIHMSTDEVYGESMLNDDIKKDENSILCPTNPYAATKAAAEMLCVSYYKSFNIPIIIIRSNNIYGDKQYIDKVIPRFIIQLLKKEKCTIQGDGSCVRSFLHIDDLIQCLELIMNEGEIGEIYNIGLGEEISILNLSKKLIKLILNSENYEDYITYINDRDFNDKRYYISDDKIRLLGWNRKINLEDGLNSTINFYKKQLNKNN